MKKYLLLLLLPGLGLAAETRAKNVILFLGDAGGIPTLNAAGIYAHDRPQSLFLQSMPYLALSDTSSLDNWVTDSAAGMTAAESVTQLSSDEVSDSARYGMLWRKRLWGRSCA